MVKLPGLHDSTACICMMECNLKLGQYCQLYSVTAQGNFVEHLRLFSVTDLSAKTFSGKGNTLTCSFLKRHFARARFEFNVKNKL